MQQCPFTRAFCFTCRVDSLCPVGLCRRGGADALGFVGLAFVTHDGHGDEAAHAIARAAGAQERVMVMQGACKVGPEARDGKQLGHGEQVAAVKKETAKKQKRKWQEAA